MHDKTKALLIAALLLPAMAVAGNENDASQNKQLQIEQIQEETALYEAMLAREKIRHELRTLEQGSVTGHQPENAAGTSSGSQAFSSPRLKEIFGIQPQLSARVILPGGTETDVRAGQALPGTLFMVEQITPDSVILEYNGNRQTLRP